MPNKKNKEINLIPQNEFDITPLGRILKWALSTFRVMVIVTELIVMSAFLSRFWLDARNSDLNDEINVNKSQVLAYSDIETALRLNQTRLNIAKSLYSEQKIDEIISSISKITPEDISFNSVSINGNQIEINSTAYLEKSIAQFLVNLDSSELINDITLTQIGSSVGNNNLTVFTISGLLN